MPRTLTASSAYSQVARQVESIRNDEHAFVPMEPGSVLRQGDLYILMLDRPIEGGKVTAGRQLAPGTSQGSRHVAEGDCDVVTVDEDAATRAINRLVPATKDQRLFIGPMIVARGEVRIAHPEHGDRTIPGDASYVVTHQRAWSNEIRRTLD